MKKKNDAVCDKMIIFAHTYHLIIIHMAMTTTVKRVAPIALALAVACVASLFVGPVRIPVGTVAHILAGHDAPGAWRYIVLQTRLPQTLTAMLCGSALACCGLLLQNLFRNPLADPSVFGISSGAALGVAVVTLALGGGALGTLAGVGATVGAAFVGALAVTALLLACSVVVRGRAALLIVGLMIGYVASAAITVLTYFATEDGVRSYLMWGMGSFANVSAAQLPLLAVPVLAALVGALLLAKRLDALLLGDAYAASMGVSVRRVRLLVLGVTGVLAAVTTAFCGPVSFIGLAVPHLTRLAVRTDRHAVLLPSALLMGALVAVVCQMCCSVPGGGGALPVNAVTPLVGAPVVLYVIMRR